MSEIQIDPPSIFAVYMRMVNAQIAFTQAVMRASTALYNPAGILGAGVPAAGVPAAGAEDERPSVAARRSEVMSA